MVLEENELELEALETGLLLGNEDSFGNAHDLKQKNDDPTILTAVYISSNSTRRKKKRYFNEQKKKLF